MKTAGKYARFELERRFLLKPFDDELQAMNLPKVAILDNYITGTNLRLRRVDDGRGKVVFKLAKKVNLSPGKDEITTIYLSAEEYRLLNTLPATVVGKTRFVLSHDDILIGLDVYAAGEDKLWLAEAEFETEAQMSDFVMPMPYESEVTGEVQFSGYVLANRFGCQSLPF